MNHPTREEWMSYLYDETAGEQHGDLTAHLSVCAECSNRVAAWRDAAKDLDAWKLPARRRHSLRIPAVARWAAAAAIVLSFGFVFGRASAPSAASVERMRAALEPGLRQQLRQEFAETLRAEMVKYSEATLATAGMQARELVENYSRVADQNRAVDTRAFLAALDKLDTQRLSDYAALKRDLDTVAVYSEAGYRQTQRQLVQLASYDVPQSGLSDSPQN